MIRAKIERGERVTRHERAELWADHIVKLDAQVAPMVRAGKVRGALRMIVSEMAGPVIVLQERIRELEERSVPHAKTGRGGRGRWRHAEPAARLIPGRILDEVLDRCRIPLRYQAGWIEGHTPRDSTSGSR